MGNFEIRFLSLFYQLIKNSNGLLSDCPYGNYYNSLFNNFNNNFLFSIKMSINMEDLKKVNVDTLTAKEK